ncbi:MAG: hypothetical protein K8W52_39855, partial [Deltaproteobacteria bacterium]|nr:hypothetical protein [Deltaproteobacteria bacterium]
MRGWFGRDAELAALTELCERARVAAVVGPPGIGKSALAHAWLAARADLGLDTAIVALADATAEDLEARIAAAGAPAAIVLDDADRVAAQAVAIGARLAAAGARVVVTARRLPAIEHRLELGPLALAHAAEQRSPAAAMFAALADSDDPAIEDLVARLEGVPLAIALAAARASVLPPAELAARLDEPFAVLRRPGEPRTNSLAGAIAWSWTALEPWVQRALAQLAVFAGAFEVATAEAIVAVGPDGSLLDALGVLREHALVQPAWPGAFRMLAMIRAYARDRGEPTMVANAVARHAAWMASRGRQHGDRYAATGDPEARAWLARALPDLDLAAQGAGAAAIEAALAADRLRAQAQPSPARVAQLDRAVGLAERTGDAALCARALDARAGAHLALGGFAPSIADRQRALALVGDGDDALAARLHLGLALAALATGELDGAHAALTAGLAAADRAGDRTARGRLGAALALHATLREDHAGARA